MRKIQRAYCKETFENYSNKKYFKEKIYYYYIEEMYNFEIGKTMWVFEDINNDSYGYRFYELSERVSSYLFKDYFLTFKEYRKQKLKRLNQ